MPRRKNGRWMLAMLVLASLVVPGVVAARQQTGAPADNTESDLGPTGVACYLRTCTNRAQCQLWCDDPGATCAPSETLPHYKFCMLQ